MRRRAQTSRSKIGKPREFASMRALRGCSSWFAGLQADIEDAAVSADYQVDGLAGFERFPSRVELAHISDIRLIDGQNEIVLQHSGFFRRRIFADPLDERRQVLV